MVFCSLMLSTFGSFHAPPGICEWVHENYGRFLWKSSWKQPQQIKPLERKWKQGLSPNFSMHISFSFWNTVWTKMSLLMAKYNAEYDMLHFKWLWLFSISWIHNSLIQQFSLYHFSENWHADFLGNLSHAILIWPLESEVCSVYVELSFIACPSSIRLQPIRSK